MSILSDYSFACVSVLSLVQQMQSFTIFFPKEQLKSSFANQLQAANTKMKMHSARSRNNSNPTSFSRTVLFWDGKKILI